VRIRSRSDIEPYDKKCVHIIGNFLLSERGYYKIISFCKKENSVLGLSLLSGFSKDDPEEIINPSIGYKDIYTIKTS
jgi:hypothetical protein